SARSTASVSDPCIGPGKTFPILSEAFGREIRPGVALSVRFRCLPNRAGTQEAMHVFDTLSHSERHSKIASGAAAGQRAGSRGLLEILGWVFILPVALFGQTTPPVSFMGVQTTVPVTGFTSMAGVAAYPGNLYVLDRGGNQVIKVPVDGS